jgi:Mn-dependent DtxR family transcriptional regulator
MSKEYKVDPDSQGPEAQAADPLRVLPAISEKQGGCLQFVLVYFQENRHYPTQREIAAALGVNSGTVEYLLQQLVEKGYLNREQKKRRNIRLTGDGLERLKIMSAKKDNPAAA